MSYQIAKPGKTRRAFAILEKIVKDDGKASYQTVESEEVDGINRDFKAGVLSEVEALRLVKQVKVNLYKKRDREKPLELFTNDNRKLLDEFWEQEYQYRHVKDQKSSRSDYERALKAVGHVSIRAGSKEDLRAQIGKHTAGDAKKQRRVTDRINTLLKFAGRNIKLPKLKKPRTKVKYINLEQLFQLLSVIKDEFIRDLCAVAFATGGRVGECLNMYTIADKRFVYIEEQLLRTGDTDDTKTGRTRRAPIVSELEEYCRRFIKYPAGIREEFDRSSLPRYLAVRCRRAGIPVVTMNDLRHSYAIHLLRRGISMTLVAQALGNSIQVCQEHYAGFELSTESLEQVVGKI